MIKPEKKFMAAAMDQAKLSHKANEYAVGAVIVQNGEILAESGVTLSKDNDPTAHAEMNAIRLASKKIKSRNLEGCILYTTHEPCVMCATAAVWAKLDGIVFGATIADMNEARQRTGQRKVIDIPSVEISKHGDPEIEVVGLFMREQCLHLLQLDSNLR